MMDSRCDRVRAPGDSLDPVQALDHVHVPQWPVHVHRPTEVPGQVNTELPPVAWFGQTAMEHMVLDVKKLVFHPVRVVEIVGQTHQAPLENRRGFEAALDLPYDVLEPDLATRGRGRVINIHTHHVGQVVSCLDIEKLGVLCTELLH